MSATSAGTLGHDESIEVVIASSAPWPTPDARLSALVDGVARREESAAESLHALYDLTAAELTRTVSSWTSGAVGVDEIVVATYVQVWHRAPARPAGLPVPKWLAGLALGQVRSLSDAGVRSARPER